MLEMSLFVFDTKGDNELLKINAQHASSSSKQFVLDEELSTKEVGAIELDIKEDGEDDCDYFGLPPPNVDLSKLIDETLQLTDKPKTKTEIELESTARLVNDAVANARENKRSKRKRVVNLDHSDFNPLTGKFDEEITLLKTDVEKELKSSDIIGGLEKLKELPSLTKKKQRELNRIERSKTKGAGWFNMPATEMTEEVRNDLKVLRMRSVLDPKHFYKKNDLKVLPKYFQIGTVQHSPLDYYSERHTRRNKKKSLVEELLADAEAQKYTKRKYKEIMAHKDKYAHRKAMKKMKKLKKNK